MRLEHLKKGTSEEGITISLICFIVDTSTHTPILFSYLNNFYAKSYQFTFLNFKYHLQNMKL